MNTTQYRRLDRHPVWYRGRILDIGSGPLTAWVESTIAGINDWQAIEGTRFMYGNLQSAHQALDETLHNLRSMQDTLADRILDAERADIYDELTP